MTIGAPHVFAAIADPTRRTLLDLLLPEERTVSDLVTQFDMSQQAVSQHLQTLRRAGLVEVTLRDGRTVSHFTRHPPGTKESPLDTAGVNAKARGLMEPVLGARRTDALIERVNALEELKDVRDLRPLLTL